MRNDTITMNNLVSHFMTMLMYLSPLFLMHPTVKFYRNMDHFKATAMNQRRKLLPEGHRHSEEPAYFDEMASEASRKKVYT